MLTPTITKAFLDVAHAQLKLADGIASTEGTDVAEEMTRAWQSLISALEDEQPKKQMFGERLFAPKKRVKNT